MRKHSEDLAMWAIESYKAMCRDTPNLAEQDVFRKILDQRVLFPGGDKDREVVLDRYGSSLNGLCYYLGLNSSLMKDMMVSRCIQYTEYIDIELEKYGVHKPLDETKRRYFKTLGLPEDAVTRTYL